MLLGGEKTKADKIEFRGTIEIRWRVESVPVYSDTKERNTHYHGNIKLVEFKFGD
jgi:hypothetical protein